MLAKVFPSRTTAAVKEKLRQLLPQRWIPGIGAKSAEPASPKQEAEEDFVEPPNLFIPTTRRELIGRIMQPEGLLQLETKEGQKFDQFAASLDFFLASQYNKTLGDVKHRYDPLDPDKDTITVHKFSEPERRDSEFWLLRGLDRLARRANYWEIPESNLKSLLREHETDRGVIVSVNPKKFTTMRVWVRSRQRDKNFAVGFLTRAYDSLRSKVTGQPKRYTDASGDIYKRVVIAVRLKLSPALTLKAFKDVRCSRLETLFPTGKIKMTSVTKTFLAATAGVAGVSVVVKSISFLNSFATIQWSYLAFLASGLIGLRVWLVYRNRRNAYLVDLSRTLYYKTVAHNRGVLTLLVDRAVDEEFKEALLVYSFLLMNLLGGRAFVGVDELETGIANWLAETYGSPSRFDCADGLRTLEKLRVLERDGSGLLGAVGLNRALDLMPAVPLDATASEFLLGHREDEEMTEVTKIAGEDKEGGEWWQ